MQSPFEHQEDSKKRFRHWAFTINNYTECDLKAVEAMGVDSAYMVCGKEVGESGTPHLQGFVCFGNKMSFKQMKTYLGRARFSVKYAKSTFKQASDYCKKDGDFTEVGVLPVDAKQAGENEKERWALALKAVQENRYEDIPPDIAARNLRGLEYAARRIKDKARKLSNIDGEMQHEWIYGPPGTGKSMIARQENPDAYIKDPTSSWFDLYDYEETVIIDDFDKYQVKQGGDMKRWLDRYIFKAQYKGGMMDIRPIKFIITSNYHPNEIWDDPITVQAICRRVKLRYMDEPYNEPIQWPKDTDSEDEK